MNKCSFPFPALSSSFVSFLFVCFTYLFCRLNSDGFWLFFSLLAFLSSGLRIRKRWWCLWRHWGKRRSEEDCGGERVYHGVYIHMLTHTICPSHLSGLDMDQSLSPPAVCSLKKKREYNTTTEERQGWKECAIISLKVLKEIVSFLELDEKISTHSLCWAVRMEAAGSVHSSALLVSHHLEIARQRAETAVSHWSSHEIVPPILIHAQIKQENLKTLEVLEGGLLNSGQSKAVSPCVLSSH